MVGDNVEYFNLSLNAGINNIDTMLYRARQAVGDKLFFDYSGLGIGNQPPNNCQYFLKYILEASHLYTPEAKNFIFQDIEELVKELPEFTRHTVNAVTDLGQIFNKIRGASLHAVIIKKDVSLEDAKKLAKQHIQGNKKFYRETENSYRFRNIPKARFKKGSLRSKKLNNSVTLIYGELLGKSGGNNK